MRILFFVMFIFGLSACGGSGSDTAGTQVAGKVDQGRVSMTKKLKGTLYYNFAAPMDSPAAMALDLKKKKYRVVSSGVSASASGDTLAFIDFCSPLSVRLAFSDADGFTSPLSECVDRETITGRDLQGLAMSPDGKKIAVLNHKLRRQPTAKEKKEDPYGLQGIAGGYEYAATQVYDLDGNILAEFAGYGPAAWTKSNRLVLGGMGGDTGYGIYQADKKLKKLKRIDDGRIKDSIWAIDAHPKKNHVAFIFNGQLYDMSLSDGKPKRLHQHGHLLTGLAYSPDGKQIAIVSNDTLDEAIEMGGSGYPIFVYDNGKIHNIRFPYVITGPLDWTK